MLQQQIMSANHTPDLEETTSKTNTKPTVDTHAFVLYSCWEKQSLTVWSYAGRQDSYIVHPLPFLWHEGSPRVTVYE